MTATLSDTYWYNSSRDEFLVPCIRLGDITDKPDQSGMLGLSSGFSSSYRFKGALNQTWPAAPDYRQELKNCLGHGTGTYYPSENSISGTHYLRLSLIDPNHTWLSYYTGGTVYAETNDRSGWSDDTYTCVYLATAVINNIEYLGLYLTGVNVGPDDDDAWIFAYNLNATDAWNEIQEILPLEPAPGQQGYKPTGTKYKGNKAIGGRGKHSKDHGRKPGYYTDILTNPGAPDESGASAIHSGMLMAYDVTDNALANFATCLFSSTLATALTGLFYNPLDFVISLNIFPCQPNIGSSTPIKLGRWRCTSADLGADASGLPLTSQFKTLDFGTIDVPENWASFLDYTHTQIELFLPFIGSVEVDTSEVMGGEINVVYTIDFFTGMCVANVNCNKYVELPDGTSQPQYSQHSYQGNCAMSIPLGQIQYGNMIGSLINAGTAGLTKGPGGFVASVVGDGVGGGFKPSVTTRGTISANAGYCSILRPYLRITRPISAESDSFQEVIGYTSYVDSKLGECEDYCVCDNIDLSSISGATESELERIKQMCLEGVHV